jgi:hypothetical protein
MNEISMLVFGKHSNVAKCSHYDRTKVVDVSIYEQYIMVKNDLVVDYRDFLPTIQPILVQFVIP